MIEIKYRRSAIRAVDVPQMKIWVDADACPAVIKEILFRAAERTGTQVTLVANQPIHTPASKYVDSLQVPAGFDVADNEIVKRMQGGDLIVTAPRRCV